MFGETMKYDNLTRDLFGKQGLAPLLHLLLDMPLRQVQPLKTRLSKAHLEVDAAVPGAAGR